jgi:predicted nucleic acid-binding protein
MTHLLDTNICSVHMRRPAGLDHRFFQHAGGIAIPTVVLAELESGGTIPIFQMPPRELSTLTSECAEEYRQLERRRLACDGRIAPHGRSLDQDAEAGRCQSCRRVDNLSAIQRVRHGSRRRPLRSVGGHVRIPIRLPVDDDRQSGGRDLDALGDFGCLETLGCQRLPADEDLDPGLA